MVEAALKAIKRQKMPDWTKPCYCCGEDMRAVSLVRHTERIDVKWHCTNCEAREVKRL